MTQKSEAVSKAYTKSLQQQVAAYTKGLDERIQNENRQHFKKRSKIKDDFLKAGGSSHDVESGPPPLGSPFRAMLEREDQRHAERVAELDAARKSEAPVSLYKAAYEAIAEVIDLFGGAPVSYTEVVQGLYKLDYVPSEDHEGMKFLRSQNFSHEYRRYATRENRLIRSNQMGPIKASYFLLSTKNGSDRLQGLEEKSEKVAALAYALNTSASATSKTGLLKSGRAELEAIQKSAKAMTKNAEDVLTALVKVQAAKGTVDPSLEALLDKLVETRLALRK